MVDDNITTRFNDYLNEERYFLDVTIACDENYQTKAHKIILSVGSLFFRNILSKAKQQ